MAILNFMPQFVPSYLKTLMEDKDDPDIEAAKEPSTGFFGGVFDYIDEAFEWTPAPEPTNPWNVANVGTQEVPFTPEPFMDPMLYDSAEWGTEPTGDFQSLGPIYGGMFGNIGDSFGSIGQDFIPPAPSFAPTGMPEATGWGFPDFPVPDPRWDYNPDTGGLGHFQALPSSYQTMDFSRFNVPAGPEAWGQVDDRRGMSFGEEFGNSLFAGLGGPSLSDVISGAAGMFGSEPVPPDLFGMGPQSSFDDRIGGSFADAIRTVSDQVSSGGAGPSPAWDQFIDLGSMVSDIVPQPRPYGMQDWGIPGMEQYAGNYELSPNWSMYGNSDVGLGMMPSGWGGMTPQQRGEQVYFSGLEGSDWLTDADYAGMTPDLAQRIGYTDSRIQGGIGNGFASLWSGLDIINSNIVQPIGDLAWDPVNQDVIGRGLNELGINPFGNEYEPLEIPLDDTVSNVREADNPWQFMELQHEDFKERPFAEQVALQFLAPGSGVYKGIEGLPTPLRNIDYLLDFAQGGSLLDNVSIPGSNRIVRDVIGPGVVGGGVGAATEAFIDPTYTDQWGNEYDPGMLESILGGSLLGIGGNAAIRSGTVPFGASTKDIPDEVSTYVRRKAYMMDDPVIPDFAGSPTFGLPGKKGAPRKLPVKLEWEDPMDKAMYMASSGGTGKSSKDAYQLLTERGFDDKDIAEAGMLIRQELWRMTEGFAGGEKIRVPRIIRPVISSAPTSVVDDVIETPAEALIRQQQEIFATDPVASRAFNRQVPTPEVSTVPPLSVADEITTPAPVVADSPVKPIIEQIDAQRQMNAASQVERERVWRAKQADIRAEAVADAKARKLTDRQAAEAGNAAVARFTIENPLGPLAVPDDAIQSAFRIINQKDLASQLRPGEASMATRVLGTWEQGKAPAKSELDTLRRILTGEDIIPSSSTIESVVTPPTGAITPDVTPSTVTTADGVVLSAPPTPKVNAPGIDPNDIAEPAPVVRQNRTVDPNDPLQGQTFTPSGIEKTDFPESEAAIQPSMNLGDEDPLRGRQLGRTPEPSDIPETVAKPIQGTMLEPVPSKYKDRVDEWMTEVRKKAANMTGEKRDDFLDKSQLQLAKRLRKDGDTEDAMRIAQLARDNAAKAIKTDRDFTDNAVRVAQIDEWRKRYEPELDKIDFDENISPIVRGRGRIKNEMADKLTDYGDRLRISLENRGFTPEEAVGAVEDEISRYLDRRAAEAVRRGDPDGLLNRTYTAIHTGPFKPKTPAGVKPVEAGVGEIRKGLQLSQDIAMEIKNSKFGLTDAAGIFANGAVAILQQPHALAAYYLAQIANMAGAKIDLNKYMEGAELAGAMFTKQTDALNPGAGSLIGHAGRTMRDTPLSKVGSTLEAIDEPLKKINFALEDIQYDKVLNQGLRKPAYQGNMLILDALSKIPVIGKYIDPTDPKTQEAVARMVNASTSAARPARDNTRRAIEATGLTSARFTRAQLDLLAMVPRLFALNNVSAEERLVIAMTALSTAGVLGAAHLAAGEELNLDWDNPKDFGDLRLPNGQGGHMTLNLLPNKQAARALALSADTIKDYLGGDLNPKDAKQKLTDAWVRFGLGRLGPAITPGLNAIGIGFDPKENTWNYPGIPGLSEEVGEGWGDTMGVYGRLARMAPLPTGGVDFVADKLTGEEASTLSRIVNFIGTSAFDDKPVTEALRAAGYKNWEEFEAEDPDTFSSRKAKFFNEHPELDQFDDTVPAKYREEKKKNSEEFMTSRTGQTVKAWRDENRDLGNNIEGAFAEMALENGERPEKDGSAQWVYDFNQTFVEARDEPLDPTSQMDMEALGELQAEFWAEHSDPKVRKEIMAYQMERAETEADKQWIASMARLNGFDPYTGKPLTYKRSGKPMPNYFEMDRYEWAVVPNDESRRFREKFEQWKLDQSAKVRELGTDKLIKMYIDTEPEVSTRENGEPWTAVAIRDVQNYGKPSKEDPVFIEYKEIMQPDLLWFKPGQYWDNIEAALEEKYGKVD